MRLQSNSANSRRVRRGVFWLLSFSSILALLLHLPGVIRMHEFGLWFGLPAGVAMVFTWLWGRKNKDEEFLRALRLGFVGGLIGTLAYDVFRVPFHITGSNPLSPIRVYGLWLAGGEASTWVTDFIGFLYHLSNGITFGWIYVIVFRKRHWAYAVVWGLFVESIAIFSAFGEVFGLIGNTPMLILALAAHVAYGIPLGWICWRDAKASEAFFPFLEKPAAWGVAMLTLLVTGWFLLARPAARPGEINGGIAIMDRGMIPSWSDLGQGASLALENRRSQPVSFRIVGPGSKQSESREVLVGPDEAVTINFEQPGITRIFAPGEKVRSVYVIVHWNGDYRPVP